MACIDRHPAVEQESDDRSVAVSGGVAQRHFPPLGYSGVDELFHDIEPADARRANDSKAGTALDEVLRRFGTAVRQTGVNGIAALAGQIGMLRLGAVVQ